MRRVKPIDSWVLSVTINGIQTFALIAIDTGAGCSLLSKAIYENMSTSLYPIRQRERDIHGVGQTTLPTIGDLICNVTIAGHHYPIDMVVSSEHEAIGCILGMDFLQTHECELSIQKGYLFINGMRIKLRRESATNTVARIKLVSDITLPGRTELAVSGKAEHMSRKISSYSSCVEPSPMMRGMAKYGIMTGCAVVQTNADNIVVPLMNTGDDTKVIRKGSTIAVMRATSKVSTEKSTYDPLGLGIDREWASMHSSQCSSSAVRTQAYDHVRHCRGYIR